MLPREAPTMAARWPPSWSSTAWFSCSGAASVLGSLALVPARGRSGRRGEESGGAEDGEHGGQMMQL